MKVSPSILTACALSALAAGTTFAADVTVPRTITADTTWTADNTYFLEGYSFVINNATLTIQPGTVIKGRSSTGAGAASLIITRGAKIMADGTAEQPIIFTSELDMLDGTLGPSDTGLWGGLVILGRATINSRANSQPAGVAGGFNEDQVEGLSVTGAEVGYASFGGTDDDDNSGVIRYVSVRHGGAVIGGDNEINGITLGGVGRGTTLEYVEVFANKDDSFEWFGGTVNGRYLVSAFGNDDSFDMDQGYRGNLQFLFSIQGDVTTDRGDKVLEWDGATSPLDATPKGETTISNLTAIGIGNSLQPDNTAGRTNIAINIRDNVTARLYNSVFVNFAQMIDVENDVGTPIPDLKNNLFFSHIAANNTAAGLNARPAGTVNASLYFSDTANANGIVDPMLAGISYTTAGLLDPRPAEGSTALTGAVATLTGAGLTAVDYKGAFKDTLWIAGWTKLAQDGYLVDAPVGASSSKFVNISTRGLVGAGDNVMVGGFFIAGSEPQTVLIRAAGPTLAAAPFNLGNTLADPVLTLFNSARAEIGGNDNWDASIANVTASVGAFPLISGSADAGMVVTLDPGLYTAQVSGKDGATGIAILEIYEVD